MKTSFLTIYLILNSCIAYNQAVVNYSKVDTFTYAKSKIILNVNGNLDGNNSKKVHEYYAAGYPDATRIPDFTPFDSLVFVNQGNTVLNAFTVLTNKENNIYCIDSICKSAIHANCNSLEDTIFSIYQYVSTHNMYYFIPEIFGNEPKEVTKHFGVYGYGHCGSIANCVVLIAERLTGLKSRWWYRGDGGHGWAEVNFGDKWFFIDADECQLLRDIDNKHYISYGEFQEDMYLGFRNKMFGSGTQSLYSLNLGSDYQRGHHEVGDLYFTNSMISGYANDSVGTFGNNLFYNLVPSEKLILKNSIGESFHHLKIPGYNDIDPDTNNILQNVRNGKYALNVLDSNFNLATKNVASTNISFLDKELKTNQKNINSSIVLSKPSQFPITKIVIDFSAILNKETDSIQIFFSRDSIIWNLTYQSKDSSINENISCLSNDENNLNVACYKYFIKIVYFSSDSISSINQLILNTTFQQSVYINPTFNLGLNEIIITGLDTNSNLKCNIAWKESQNTSIPSPPTFPIYPLNNDTITNVRINFSWQPIYTNSNGDSIVEWYFQVSESPDFKNTLCGQFDQYSGKLNTSNFNTYFNNQYRLYSSDFDFYNNNTKYYWRIKNRDSKNTWSEWSDTWSYIIKCPMHPINVRFEQTENENIYKLKWNTNPNAIQTPKFILYASSNRYISPYNYWLSEFISNDTFCTINISENNNNFRITAFNNISQSSPSRIVKIPNKVNAIYRNPILIASILENLQKPVKDYPGLGRKYFLKYDNTFFVYDSIEKRLIPIKTGRSMVSICYLKYDLFDTIYKYQMDVFIQKANLFISLKDTNSIYGNSIKPMTISFDSIGYNQSLSDVFSTIPTANYSNIDSTKAGFYNVGLVNGVLLDTNYLPQYFSGNYEIKPRELLIKSNASVSIYGDTLNILPISYSGFVNNDNDNNIDFKPNSITNASSNSNVGEYFLTTYGGADSNYIFIYDTSTYNIVQRKLLVIPIADSFIYGSNISLSKIEFSGFVNNEDASHISIYPTLATTANSQSKVGNYTIAAFGGYSQNYYFEYDSAFVTIFPKGLTIKANPSSSIYGTIPVFSNLSYEGFVNGDTIFNMQSLPLLICNADSISGVGNYPINVYGAIDSNYKIVYENAIHSITPSNLIITANNSNSIYGQNPIFENFSYNGFVNGDTDINLQILPSLSCNANLSAGVGTYQINAFGALDSNYTISYQSAIHTITPAALIIAANNSNSVYGQNPVFENFSYSGFVNGDTDINLQTIPYISCNANSVSGVGTYEIDVFDAIDSNYNISFQSAIHTITPATLIISANNSNSLYGQNPIFENFSYTGFVNGETDIDLQTLPSLNCNATSASSIGAYEINAFGAIDSNYSISYQNAMHIVNPTTLIISANNSNSVYGQNPIFENFSYTGFVNGDTDINLQTSPSIYCNANSTNGVGNYQINAFGALDSNYNIIYENAFHTIIPATLVISANNSNSVYGQNPIFENFSYSGFVNGDTDINLQTAPSLYCNATSVSGIGAYEINAIGAIDSNYNISYQSALHTITPAPLIISANNSVSNYGQIPTFENVSYTGFVNGDTDINLQITPSLYCNATSNSGVGNYEITAFGAIDSNYSISYQSAIHTVTPTALIISANNSSSIYGQNPIFENVTYQGFVNGDNETDLEIMPIVNCVANNASAVGSYVVIVSGALDSNYNISYQNATHNIVKSSLVIKANPSVSAYGSNPLLSELSYTGFLNGDTISNLVFPPTVNCTANSSSNVGEYAIVIGGAYDTNYNIIYQNSIHTILPANLFVSISNSSSIYGDYPIFSNVSYSGFVNGDSIIDLQKLPTVFCTATNLSKVGTYQVAATGGIDSNYNFIYSNAIHSISPRQLMIQANNSNSVYGQNIILNPVSYFGFVNGDTNINLQLMPSVFCNANPSSYIGNYGISVFGANDSNYTITYQDALHIVTPAPLIIVASNSASIYGQNPILANLVYNGFVNGDTNINLQQQANVGCNCFNTSTVGNYLVSVSGALDSNYSITYQNASHIIYKATLHIYAKDTVIEYGDTVFTNGYFINGFANSDNESNSINAPIQLYTNAIQGSVVDNYDITLQSILSSINYNINFHDGSIKISKANLKVRILDTFGYYLTNVPEIKYTIENFKLSNSIIDIDTLPIFKVEANPNSNSGSYPIIIDKAAVDSNYNFIYTDGNFIQKPIIPIVNTAFISRDYKTVKGLIKLQSKGGDTVRVGMLINDNVDVSKNNYLLDFNGAENDTIANFTNLSPKTYYIRGYATNAAGVGYGEIIEVKFLNNKEFIIYPNPVSDLLTIIIDYDASIPVNAILYDEAGKIIMSLSLNSNNNDIDMRQLAKGNYYLKLIRNNKIIVEKIIKN